jgi:hypothetical protein
VLVIGGGTGSERYIHSTREWQVADPTNVTRRFHTATLLPDGRVLVAGGEICDSTLQQSARAPAVLFDPVARTWTATADLLVDRSRHTATLLKNGNVLVVGGVKDRTLLTTSPACCAEIYDPRSGQWSETSQLDSNFYGHQAALLSNETVLVAGGSNEAVLYTPSPSAWRHVSRLIVSSESTVTALSDGKALITGGYDPDTEVVMPRVYLYKPASEK